MVGSGFCVKIILAVVYGVHQDGLGLDVQVVRATWEMPHQAIHQEIEEGAGILDPCIQPKTQPATGSILGQCELGRLLAGGAIHRGGADIYVRGPLRLLPGGQGQGVHAVSVCPGGDRDVQRPQRPVRGAPIHSLQHTVFFLAIPNPQQIVVVWVGLFVVLQTLSKAAQAECVLPHRPLWQGTRSATSRAQSNFLKKKNNK